jgi:hypothetical protein
MRGHAITRLSEMVNAVAFRLKWHVWVLSGAWLLILIGTAAAFDAACGNMATASSAVVQGFPAVVEVHSVGRATGTYRDSKLGGATWHLSSGEFMLSGRGVVMGQFVVTAAHVVYPSQVELRLHEHTLTVSSVVNVDQMTVYVSTGAGTERVRAEIVHLNHRFDLAILRPEVSLGLPAFPYRASVTWWRETAGEASSLLRTGDCVVALTAERNPYQVALPGSEPRAGRVVAPYAVSSESSVVTGLNVNTVTISTLLLPGDSGSPVVAFDAGKARLVGVAIATRHPFEAVSYISRLDPLLPILEALQTPPHAGVRVAQAR